MIHAPSSWSHLEPLKGVSRHLGKSFAFLVPMRDRSPFPQSIPAVSEVVGDSETKAALKLFVPLSFTDPPSPPSQPSGDTQQGSSPLFCQAKAGLQFKVPVFL